MVTIGNVTFQAILYMTLVYFFLDLDGNIISVSLESVVTDVQVRDYVSTMAQEVIAGLFVVNTSGAILQAVYTWLIFDFMGVKCVYLYALIGAFFKTVPFTSTWLVGLVATC